MKRDSLLGANRSKRLINQPISHPGVSRQLPSQPAVARRPSIEMPPQQNAGSNS
jgi:hypothetical protein